MTWAAALFWFSTACIMYAYIGYPLLLMFTAAAHQLRSDWRKVAANGSRRITTPLELPHVAVLVAAHNEELNIAERVRNLLAQDYPAERLRIVIGSDGSTDRTVEILAALGCERVTCVHVAQRRGKAATLNDLVALTTAEVLVFSDANTSFRPDTIAKLVRYFREPEVGCVCGELRLVRDIAHPENQDHIYWRYERLLKFFESRIGGLLGANGGVYALRRSSYQPIPAQAIVDDFWISMQVIEAGQRCVYDPEAIALETIPHRLSDEFRRRVRIGMGNYQALKRFAGMLGPRHGAVAFTFLSHKCLRWFVPHFMVLAFISNLLLAGQGGYTVLLLGQILFYAAAWFGWRKSRQGDAPRWLRLPLFFVSMNLGLLVGFWRFATSGTTGVWARSAR